jgi:hypothetical protein
MLRSVDSVPLIKKILAGQRIASNCNAGGDGGGEHDIADGRVVDIAVGVRLGERTSPPAGQRPGAKLPMYKRRDAAALLDRLRARRHAPEFRTLPHSECHGGRHEGWPRRFGCRAEGVNRTRLDTSGQQEEGS